MVEVGHGQLCSSRVMWLGQGAVLAGAVAVPEAARGRWARGHRGRDNAAAPGQFHVG